MEKSSSYKLIGAPCGQHGQYTFYKALRVTGASDQVIAIGDFFFVKIWQDSELVSVGELQLLWTDRVSDQTLVSLRLYFLPENTPEGRNGNGEDEVLAINDKVVLRVEDLLSWLCRGDEWHWGLRAVWRGACAPPADPKTTLPLHYTKLDFADVEKEKNSLVIDETRPGVVVFSYPRYCRYRALVSRLEGAPADWLRDALVAALGGYAAPTHNTRILYCKDTFEYPELEGHEFVCNHLAPKMKGRPRGRRRRRPVSRSASRSSDSASGERRQTPRRLSLRNGKTSEDEEPPARAEPPTDDERAFVRTLRKFYKSINEPVKFGSVVKEVSLHSLYLAVRARGGHGALCGSAGGAGSVGGAGLAGGGGRAAWRGLGLQGSRPAVGALRLRAIYERYLLPYENHERRTNPRPLANGQTALAIDTIDVPDSPPGSEPASPGARDQTEDIKPMIEKRVKLDTETGEQEPIKEEEHLKTEPARKTEDLRDLKPDIQHKISVKPVEKLIDTKFENISEYIKNNDLVKHLASANSTLINELATKYGMSDANTMLSELSSRQGLSEKSSHFLNELAQKLNLGQADPSLLSGFPRHPLALNGHRDDNKDQSPRPLGRSSLRSVRVKPAREGRHNPTAPTAPAQSDSASSSPPVAGSTPGQPVTNFGINYPPQPAKEPASDDEIVEVPYRPKTPEIIDLDAYPESPQGLKKKKLDILKERGLEVTAVPTKWPPNTVMPGLNPTPLLMNPAMQHQILTQAQIFQMYNVLPNYSNGVQPPKVIQGKSIFGSSGPEKTVYGNPKDQFMPPPHIMQGTPIKPKRSVQTSGATPTPQDILDLTCKSLSPQKPTVEIMRVDSSPSPSKSAKNYTLVDGKAVVGSNLEITLVSPKSQSPVKRQPQKRLSNGQLLAKPPTPPKEAKFPPQSHGSKKLPPLPGVSALEEALEEAAKSHNISQSQRLAVIDPVYLSALYSRLGGQLVGQGAGQGRLGGQGQLALYRDLLAAQHRHYGPHRDITDTPTTRN